MNLKLVRSKENDRYFLVDAPNIDKAKEEAIRLHRKMDFLIFDYPELYEVTDVVDMDVLARICNAKEKTDRGIAL